MEFQLLTVGDSPTVAGLQQPQHASLPSAHADTDPPSAAEGAGGRLPRDCRVHTRMCHMMRETHVWRHDAFCEASCSTGEQPAGDAACVVSAKHACLSFGVYMPSIGSRYCPEEILL